MATPPLPFLSYRDSQPALHRALLWELAMGVVERGPWVSMRNCRLVQVCQTSSLTDLAQPRYAFFLWSSVLTFWRPRPEPAVCGGVKGPGDTG